MDPSPDEFQDLRRLLALKRHEQPPPGYFNYLPDQIGTKIQRGDLSEHSTWWEWMVERFDARPVLASAYACVISGLMLLGVKVSRDLQAQTAAENLFPGIAAEGPHPLNIVPGDKIRGAFENPAGLLYFSSTEAVFDEPASVMQASFSNEGVMFAH